MDDPRFTLAPTFGKVAVGGRWEDALVLQAGELNAAVDLVRHLGGAEEVACEAFFGTAFFGVRNHGPDVAQFVRAFAAAMDPAADGAAFFTRVRDLGVALETQFAFAELGAEGAWNSVGPFRIQDPCGADLDVLWQHLTASPVGRDTTHDKALEFTFAGGLSHWFALPVSDAGVLSRHLVEDALRSFCG
jgi:hypothetical protein